MMLRIIGVSVLVGFGLIVAQAYEGNPFRGLTLQDSIERALEPSRDGAATFDQLPSVPFARAGTYAPKGSD